MTQLAPRSRIPTIAVAVERHLARQAITNKSLDDHVSVLQGPSGRVVGKRAAGPALARSHLGQLRCDRLTSHELAEWFVQRCPSTLAAATRKRSMSSVRVFVQYCIDQGWMHEEVLQACPTIRVPKNAAKDWVKPEQLAVILTVTRDSDLVDPFDRFIFDTLIATGMRTSELPGLRPRHLDRETLRLRVTGKGTGEGKTRLIPIGPEYVEIWDAHIAHFEIPPDGYLVFSRPVRPIGGQDTGMERDDHVRTAGHDNVVRAAISRIDEVVRDHLARDVLPPFKIYPQALRRTYATIALIAHALGEGGMDVYSIQEAMGHDDLHTTAGYLSDANVYIDSVRERHDTATSLGAIIERAKGTPTTTLASA